MAHSKVKERLESIPQEDLDKAQERLNAFCAEHQMNPIPLNHGKASWRELVYRMIGLPHQKAGKAGSPEKVAQYIKEEVFEYMEIISMFDTLDDQGKRIKNRPINEHLYEHVKKKYPKIKKDDFERTIEVLKNYRKSKGKKRLKEIEKERLLINNQEDWPD